MRDVFQWMRKTSVASQGWAESSKSRWNEIVETSPYTGKSYGALDWLS